MNRIAIAPEFIPAIKNGTKTSTIRHGKREYEFGDAVFYNAENEDEVINIEITCLDYLHFGTLNDEDAKRDGFASLEDLKNTLLRFYPGLQDDHICTIVKFKVK